MNRIDLELTSTARRTTTRKDSIDTLTSEYRRQQELIRSRLPEPSLLFARAPSNALLSLRLDLFFQVITLAESFSKLVSNLLSVARDSSMNIRNLSSEFTFIFNGLNDFLNDLRTGKEDPPTIDTNNLPNRDTAIAYISQCLHSKTYSNVIKYLRSAR